MSAVPIHHEDPEVIDLTEPATDPHDGRPMRPEYAERGAALMAQWEAGTWPA